MGKGDQRSRRGKIWRGTFGKRRPKTSNAVPVKVAAAPAAPVTKPVRKKAAPLKVEPVKVEPVEVAPVEVEPVASVETVEVEPVASVESSPPDSPEAPAETSEQPS